jgi:O-antigen ligase
MAAFLTCAVICLYAIVQIPTGNRVSAPFEGEGGEPNTLGGYLVLMLSLTAGLFLTAERSKEKLSLAFMGCLIFVPLLYSLSRSSWIALVPMYLSFLVYSRKKLWLLSFLGIFIVASWLFMPGKVVERARSTFEEEQWEGTTETIAGISFDPSTSERISRYRESLGRWSRHPLLGYGVTGGGFIDGQFLRTLEETGCAGLLVMLWLFASIFRKARANYRALSDPFFSGLSLGLMGGVAALCGHALGSSTFIIVRIMEPFWLMAAIVMSAPAVLGQRPDPSGEKAALLKARIRSERPISEKVGV